MMKKTYTFKPLAVMAFVFDTILLISGLMTLILMNGLNSLSALSSIGMLINVLIFFMAGLLGAVVTAILFYIYYAKREKAIAILAGAVLHTIIALLFVFMLMTNIGSQLFFGFGILLILIAFIANLGMLLRLDEILQINTFNMYLPAGKNVTQTQSATSFQATEVSNEMNGQFKEPVITGEKVKTFLKSKNGKITLIILAIVVCLFGGYKVWDQFFNKTQIDAFKDMTVSFDGYNGAGKVNIDKPTIDHDKTDPDMAMFIAAIDYQAEKDGQLSNGDKVKITVQYSKETASKLNVVVKEESREFEVKGLTIKYQSVDQIDKATFQKAYQMVDKKAQSYLLSDEKLEFYKAYYYWQADQDINLQRNKLIFVYKESYQSYDFAKRKDVTKTKYTSYYVSFDSGFNAEEGYVSSRSLFNSGSYSYVEKESDVLAALQETYSSYSSTEGKIAEVPLAVK